MFLYSYLTKQFFITKKNVMDVFKVVLILLGKFFSNMFR